MKSCTFKLSSVDEREVSKLLKALLEHGSVGTDMLDSGVLCLAADYILDLKCRIIVSWMVAYISQYLEIGGLIPLTKAGRLTFTGQNNRSITILLVLRKVERIVHSQKY